MKALHSIYDFVISAVEKMLTPGGLLFKKLKLFSEGRKASFSILEKAGFPQNENIWIHASSLGEYEQAVPVIIELKKLFPEHKIVLSFFSPSGYENKKDSSLADVVVYLPLDTSANMKRFLDLVNPQWALIIKYEFWPNLLAELKRRTIRTVLISANFREGQSFFKPVGRKFWKRYLNSFEHFFVQNEKSRDLLKSIGYFNVTVSGDTRFDRVAEQISQDNSLDFISSFKGAGICVVAGSTWPEDEDLLLEYINSNPEVKFIIAPHKIDPVRIAALKKQLRWKTALFSRRSEIDLSVCQVFIIDAIGYLGRIYSYGEIAYVGGAAGNSGLHNILEPAAFGIPVVIGKNHSRFPEAADLEKLGGLLSVSSKEELRAVFDMLIKDFEFRAVTGRISKKFVDKNTGATAKIASFFLKNS